MKYFTLIWAGLWRKPLRTILTALCVSLAFLLFGVLHGVTATFDDAIDLMDDSRIRTTSRVNLLEAMPMSHLARIEGVEGINSVAWYSIFFGYYQEPSNGIGVGAIPFERFLKVFPDMIIAEDQKESLLHTRGGAAVGKDLAEEYGWKVGDRVPIRSNRIVRADGADDWAFDILGIYELDGDFPANEFWIDYEFFDESRADGKGTVNFFFMRIDDPERSAEISEEVDALFANSMNETKTQSDKEYLRAQIDQIGDVEFFVYAIIGAVLFTLLFLTGNTMMQSVRERVPELAVLKTYGYSDSKLIALVCIEALILCGFAALAGLLVAGTIFPSIFSAIGAPALRMPVSVIATGVAISAIVALISTAPPVWRVHRLKIVDALAGR
jgi:putative ABC transport system permease protein